MEILKVLLRLKRPDKNRKSEKSGIFAAQS